MAFQFKVAYTTDPTKIAPALTKGVIDEGDLIIVNENNQKGTLNFITNEQVILPISAPMDQE